jgi:acetolactate synthase-1/2/3 large subunit
VLAEADVILAIDSDVPWIPAVNRPSAGAAIYCVDVDPLKSQMSMWHLPARRFAQASARLAVEQITRYVRENDLADPRVVEVRRAAAARAHDQELAERASREHPRSDSVITAEYLTACVRHLLEDEDALVLTEVVTNGKTVAEHLRPNRPGSVIHHGGGSLGWAGGAAYGVTVSDPGELPQVLKDALAVVHGGRSAVVSVHIPAV